MTIAAATAITCKEDVRAWREPLDLTQTAAAELLGIAHSTWASYEYGRVLVQPRTVRTMLMIEAAGIDALRRSGVVAGDFRPRVRAAKRHRSPELVVALTGVA